MYIPEIRYLRPQASYFPLQISFILAEQQLQKTPTIYTLDSLLPLY